MRRTLTVGLALLALPFVVSIVRHPVQAATLNCTISTGGLALGQYDVFYATDSLTVLSSAIQYTCDKSSTPVLISLGPSSGTNDFIPRKLLKTGVDPLFYYVSLGGFTTACGGGSGQVWGDSTLNNTTTSYFGISGTRSVPTSIAAYGCIPHNQNVEGGVHSDSLLVTISF